jgi:hypothetical protein
MDNIFTMKQIIQKHIRQVKVVHTAFTDLEKAYDGVPINRLWKEMEKIGVRIVLIKATKKLHENNYIQIKNGNELPEPILVEKGLRQGVASPLLHSKFI